MAAVAARYRAFIGRARAASPMVALVANDLDGVTFVYRDVGKHPRDFYERQFVSHRRRLASGTIEAGRLHVE